jgi:hypothetical protein
MKRERKGLEVKFSCYRCNTSATICAVLLQQIPEYCITTLYSCSRYQSTVLLRCALAADTKSTVLPHWTLIDTRILCYRAVLLQRIPEYCVTALYSCRRYQEYCVTALYSRRRYQEYCVTALYSCSRYQSTVLPSCTLAEDTKSTVLPRCTLEADTRVLCYRSVLLQQIPEYCVTALYSWSRYQSTVLPLCTLAADTRVLCYRAAQDRAVVWTDLYVRRPRLTILVLLLPLSID